MESWGFFHRIKTIVIFSVIAFVIPLHTKPRLTVVIVIDQFAYYYLDQCKAFLSGGINYFLGHGIQFTNAYYPHAMPETAPGHTALNTGVFPKDHGIIANSWITADGTRMKSDQDDNLETAAVFSTTGLYEYGKSAKNTMVDGISDQFMMYPDLCCSRHHVYALSIKSRAAIGMAGKLGKAIWFDECTGNFTSSKAYFEQLPNWVKNFNTTHNLSKHSTLTWSLMFNRNSKAYAAVCTTAPEGYTMPKPFAGTTIPMKVELDKNYRYGTSNEPCHAEDSPAGAYMNFIKTPQANKHLLTLAKECICNHLRCGRDQELLLWISLSSLDLAGHVFGPQSLEVIDMIYHLDCQLFNFIRWVYHRIKCSDVLWVLTADHGIGPIPEYVHAEGLTSAQRIDTKPLLANLNQRLKKNYGIDGAVFAIEYSNIYVNAKKIGSLKPERQKALRAELHNQFAQAPGIKKIWSYEELATTNVDRADIVSYFKNQLYPGRSGAFIYQTYPYTYMTSYHQGASHETPYNYDTHVPLIIYQKGCFDHKIVNDTVLMLQLAPTLAQILQVPKPSACMFNFLPGTIAHEVETQ